MVFETAIGEGSYITSSLKFQLVGSKMPVFLLIYERTLKNKKILHLGAWKRLDFSQWVKGTFQIKVSKQQKSQPYILVRDFFEILVSKSYKNSAVYKSERVFKKVFVCGFKKCWFSYRYIRCKIFFRNQGVRNSKKMANRWGNKIFLVKVEKTSLLRVLGR